MYSAKSMVDHSEIGEDCADCADSCLPVRVAQGAREPSFWRDSPLRLSGKTPYAVSVVG